MKDFIAYAKRNNYIDDNGNISGTTLSFNFVIDLMSEGEGINQIAERYQNSLGNDAESIKKGHNTRETLLQIFDLMRREVNAA